MRSAVLLSCLLLLASTSHAQVVVVDFGPFLFPQPSNPRDQVFEPNSYDEDGFHVAPNEPTRSSHFDIYDRDWNTTPDQDSEINLHGGANSAESVIVTSDSPPFSLLSLDVEFIDFVAPAEWEVVSSSGAVQLLTTTGTVNFGPGFTEITHFTIRSTVVPSVCIDAVTCH